MKLDLHETFSQELNIMTINDLEDDPILQVSSQEPPMSSNYDFKDLGGSWHTYIQARELKFCTQVKNHISWPSMTSRWTLSSKSLVRNHHRPPSLDIEDGWVLEELLIMLESWNLAHKSRYSYHDHPWMNEPILQVSSQEPSPSSKYGLWGQGVIDALLIMLESWNLAHK